MKVTKFFLSGLLGLLVSTGYGANLKAYVVNIANKYPYNNSYLKLQNGSVIPSDSGSYCPAPPKDVDGIETQSFQYGMCNARTVTRIASEPASVIYRLSTYDAQVSETRGVQEILTCRLDYSFDSAANACHAVATVLYTNNLADCKAKVILVADGICTINFTFVPHMSPKRK